MRELKDLPNRSGFKFIGILKDGTEKECEVKYGPASMKISCGRGFSSTEVAPDTYYVSGVQYNKLAGWRQTYEKAHQ